MREIITVYILVLFPSTPGVLNLLLLTSTTVVLLFAREHRHKMFTITSIVKICKGTLSDIKRAPG
jgi:uncharacterized membrane protein YccC